MTVRKGNHGRRGFSLIELVIVVVIIGIIGAIAIPRMSRGAAGAADSALKANLAVLRNALDLYAVEHGGVYPDLAALNKKSIVDDGTNGGNPLLDYSTADGTSVGTLDEETGLIYGPYLRNIPALPIGANKGDITFVAGSGGTTGAWVYNKETGRVTANIAPDKADAKGVFYKDY